MEQSNKRKRSSSGSSRKKAKTSRTRSSSLTSGYANSKMRNELKLQDQKATTNTFSTTAQFVSLNIMTQGTDVNNRIGRQIFMKSAHITGYIYPTATTVVQDYARVMLVYDKQPQGAYPIASDLLKDTAIAGTATTSLSELNINNRKRFVVLRDLRFILPAVTITAGVVSNLTMLDPIRVSFNIKEYVKLKGLECEYGSNNGDVTDINTGNLFMFFFSANGSADWTCTWNARLRYFD